MTYIVTISSGDVLETEDEAQYVAWLDEHGPEVVSSDHAESDSEILDRIARLLDRRVWNADTLVDVARIVVSSGRSVGDI